MKYRVVTTCHPAGWAEYGQRCVASVLERWSPDLLPLILYAEGFTPDRQPGLEVRQLPAWIDTFKAEFSTVPLHRGQTLRGYDYRFDAIKFAHKVAALTDAALSCDPDTTLIWLDADTFTHAAVDTAWLDSLFPDPERYLAWLDRANTHPECGFVMFRCGHPYHRAFMERFRDLYTSGDVFRLRESHDSFVLQHLALVKQANGKIPAPVSLSGDGYRTSHVFINGPVGARLDHRKGPRKSLHRSPRRDLIRPRAEPYWQDA